MKLPQLSLRGLFWLTALVAVCLAWWVDRTAVDNWHREREKQLIEMVERDLKTDYGGPVVVRERRGVFSLALPNDAPH